MIETDAQYQSRDSGMTLIGRFKKGHSRFDADNSFGSGAHTIGKNLGPYLRFEGLRDRDRKHPQSERSKFMERTFARAHGGNLNFLHAEVYLPYADLDLNYQNWRLEYTGSGAVKTRCTGKNIVQKQVKTPYKRPWKGKQVTRFNVRLENVYEPCPFAGNECLTCGYSRKLLVIPRCFYDDDRASFWGVVALESKAKHDGRLISVLNRELERLRSLFHFFPEEQVNLRSVPLVQNFLPLSRETANYIPYILRRTEAHIQKPVIGKDGNDSGKRFGDTEYLLDMEIAPWWFRLMQDRVDALKRQALQGGLIDDSWRWIPPSKSMMALPTTTSVDGNFESQVSVIDDEDIPPIEQSEIIAEVRENLVTENNDSESYRNRLISLCKLLKIPQNGLSIVTEALSELNVSNIVDEKTFQTVCDHLLVKWSLLQSQEVTPEGVPIPLFLSEEDASQPAALSCSVLRE